MKSGSTNSFKRRRPIQQRLPLLICILLLSAIAIYGFANYYTLRKAALEAGTARLSTLTDQISGLLGQSSQIIVARANTDAAQSTVVKCTISDGKKFKAETIDLLDKLPRDTNWVFTGLFSATLKPLLHSHNSTDTTVLSKFDLKNVLAYNHLGPGSGKVGRIFQADGLMYYPVISTVTDNNQLVGYIIGWVRLRATKQAVVQLSKLVGTGAGFYLVNTDESLWTNMIKPTGRLPMKVSDIKSYRPFTYSDATGQRMIASAKPVMFTDWWVIVEFPEYLVLDAVGVFLKWIIAVGIVIMAIGFFAAWYTSRNITRPLKELTLAAESIIKADYSTQVSIEGHEGDELGMLSQAFNTMTGQVAQMHHDLEDKVEERTRQLENANKELEAFSYSVSHDLRTPLRAINGYAIMLKEDYESELDAEGKRILGNIVSNAKMMGQLIDDLLTFSRLGKKELVLTTVDMQALTSSVINELLQQSPENKYTINIAALPPVQADHTMIKQALINLLGNAIKYSAKKDAPVIDIGYQEDEISITYYIKDNGAGFDMAYAGKLFGVFQRLHSMEEFEGTGVGLALVKRIINKHKGKIWAEGEEKKGATFYFSLPKY